MAVLARSAAQAVSPSITERVRGRVDATTHRCHLGVWDAPGLGEGARTDSAPLTDSIQLPAAVA